TTDPNPSNNTAKDTDTASGTPPAAGPHIVAVGTIPGFDFGLAGYNADGSLDTTGFGTNGFVDTDFGTIRDAAMAPAIQADGKILAVGFTGGTAFDFAVARYNTDGSLDTTGFGTGGKVVTDFGTNDDEARAVAIQADGKIVVAGYTHTGGQYDF